jgi:trans-2,3-dihydro-3-hydroxyanthranilate isomerase
MREYRFYQVDVFTTEPFTGNPLAVVPDADGLSDQEMRRIAHEMSLPETTFVVAPRAADSQYRMRIFTPTVELPFTGHPAIGAHWVMASLGRVPLTGPVTRVVYEQGVGRLTADFLLKDGALDLIMMSQPAPVFMSSLRDPRDVRDLAKALGIEPEEISATGLAIQVVSTGMPVLIVPLHSLAAVQRLDAAAMDLATLAGLMEPLGANFVLVFTTQTERPEARVHVRGFGHLLGIPEDPVTGNANGSLGAYLVRHGILPATGQTLRYTSEQGSEIDRPGTLEVEVDHEGGIPTAVRVGGRAVSVMEGVLRF